MRCAARDAMQARRAGYSCWHRRRHAFDHGFFLVGGWVQGMGGWVGGGIGGVMGLRVGFININDMYNNDVGKGGAQGCEAYEVK